MPRNLEPNEDFGRLKNMTNIQGGTKIDTGHICVQTGVLTNRRSATLVVFHAVLQLLLPLILAEKDDPYVVS